MAIVLQAELPTSGVASYVAELAKRYGVRAMRMPLDDLADVVTRLSDDEVHGDATQEMIVALARAEVIDRRSNSYQVKQPAHIDFQGMAAP